jgi:DNA repair protein RecO (recombination protein O)
VNFQPKHTLALVLFRTDYAESDRIATFLTKDYGKLRVIAKGVRKERAKLAAGVELFCISEIGFITGRSELATLVSARSVKSYHHFLGDLTRVEFGFSSLKRLNRIVADGADSQYFNFTEKLLEALDDKEVSLAVTQLWWQVNLAQLTGHGINLHRTISGQEFKDNCNYYFDQERGGFVQKNAGEFGPNHIKLLRLAQDYLPKSLMKIKNANLYASNLNETLPSFIDFHH